MWYKHKFFKYTSGIILVLVIIYLVGQVGFFWRFMAKIFAALFPPLVIAGFLYYLFRPLLKWMEKIKIPTTLSILLLYLIFAGLGAVFSFYAGGLIKKEAFDLFNDLPGLVQQAMDNTGLTRGGFWGFDLIERIRNEITPALGKATWYLKNGLLAAYAGINRVVGLMVTIPFILYYLLQDHGKINEAFVRLFPGRYRGEVSKVLEESDNLLSTYVTGQAILALGQGTLMYLGFLLIGLPFALVLGLFVLITSFIPVFGLLIGAIPAVLVGVAQGSWMALKVLGIWVIVNSLRKLVGPTLVSNRLKIHSLTLIFLFIVAGAGFGFIGVLVVVPVYAVLRVVWKGTVRIRQNERG